MVYANTLASVEIDVGESPERMRRPEPDSPFHILVAGDFSGGASRALAPIEVDRDNFDSVMARLAPEIRVPLDAVEAAVSVRELDDFHPDRLFKALAPFRALRDLRRRLEDRETFAAAAAELAAPEPAPRNPPDLSGAAVLSMMMGEAPARAAEPPRGAWDEMLHSLVAPYLEAKPDPRQADLIAQVDAAIAGQMRALLAHPRFQSLEAAWRGLHFLVRRLETGESLKVFALDLPERELVTSEGLADFWRIAVDSAALAPDAEPWAVIAGLYAFAPEQEAVLAALGRVARAAGAPFLAGLAPDVVGLEDAFLRLRRVPEAQWIGLALPRFLLRLPYGKHTSPAGSFDFEEMPSHKHEHYLWGNPALVCACLLGEAFTQRGWEMRPGAVNEIDDLPMHVHQHNGEAALKPCAEVWLTEEAAELLLDRGFIPLISIKGTGAVRAPRIQSIAESDASLAGRWRR
jgi:type VI secretion system protein ImpC